MKEKNKQNGLGHGGRVQEPKGEGVPVQSMKGKGLEKVGTWWTGQVTTKGGSK